MASLGEVRHRADCIVLVGDGTMLQRYPNLISLLAASDTRNDSADTVGEARRRWVVLGDWSDDAYSALKSYGNEVCSVSIDIQKVPRMLAKLERMDRDALQQSDVSAASWMVGASILPSFGLNETLDQNGSDVWIESMYRVLREAMSVEE